MTSVHFSDHAAWRAAERHGESVKLDELADRIAAAIDGGWVTKLLQGGTDRTVVIPGGRQFIVRPCDNGWVVVTSLG